MVLKKATMIDRSCMHIACNSLKNSLWINYNQNWVTTNFYIKKFDGFTTKNRLHYLSSKFILDIFWISQLRKSREEVLSNTIKETCLKIYCVIFLNVELIIVRQFESSRYFIWLFSSEHCIIVVPLPETNISSNQRFFAPNLKNYKFLKTFLRNLKNYL